MKTVLVSIVSFSAGVYATAIFTKKVFVPFVVEHVAEQLGNAIDVAVDEEGKTRLLAEMNAIIFANQIQKYSDTGKG